MAGMHQILPRLTIRQILRWADAHFSRTGRWPSITSVSVIGAPSETWARINGALRHGYRGLSGGGSLAKLLVGHRAIRRQHPHSALVDTNHRRLGTSPFSADGQISDVEIGPCYRRAGRVMAHHRSGTAAGAARPNRPIIARQASGRVLRRQQPSEPTAAERQKGVDMGRCVFC